MPGLTRREMLQRAAVLTSATAWRCYGGAERLSDDRPAHRCVT